MHCLQLEIIALKKSWLWRPHFNDHLCATLTTPPWSPNVEREKGGRKLEFKLMLKIQNIKGPEKKAKT